jgi:hypothetical protein
MAKSQSSELSDLIGVMSKSEKRFFKIYASRHDADKDKKFIQVFDFIEKHGDLDPEQLLQEFPDIKRIQLSNIKAHLFDNILESLQLFHADKSTDAELLNMISSIHILYDKTLYKSCAKLIAKAKAKATRSNKYVLLLEILELEKFLINQTTGEGNVERVKDVTEQTAYAAKAISNINKFTSLVMNLNAFYAQKGYARSQKDIDDITALFETNMPDYDETKLTFYEKLYLYYANATFYFFTQNFKVAYKFAGKGHGLFHEYPEMRWSEVELYIRILNNMLVAQTKLFLIDEFTLVYKELESVKRHELFPFTHNILLIYSKYLYIHKINKHFMTAAYGEGCDIVNKLESRLIQFANIFDRKTMLLFYYKIACLFFGAKRYKDCSKWLYKIVNDKDVNIREDLQCFARIMLMICHYELDEKQLLEYQSKATHRYLLKKGNFNQYESIVIKYMKILHYESEPRKVNLYLKEMQDQLLAVTKNRFEKRAFLYFDMVAWIESKLNNTAIGVVMRFN